MNQDDADACARAALATLKRLGYGWHGGDEWQPVDRIFYMAAKGHMTLGEAVDVFAVKYPDNAKVFIDYNNAGISKESPHSWRGDYSHLAFAPSPANTDCYSVFNILKSCIGKHYEGYKGGACLMDRDTPIYIANYSHMGRKIIGFSFDEKNNTVVILTEKPVDE